jgi:hypothetical protein
MYGCLRRRFHPKQPLLIHFNFLLLQLSKYSETEPLSKMSWHTDVTESQEFRIVSQLMQPDFSISTVIDQLLDLTSVAAASTTVSASEALLTHLDNTWQALIDNSKRFSTRRQAINFGSTRITIRQSGPSCPTLESMSLITGTSVCYSTFPSPPLLVSP